jgi:hypothetical protein
MISLDDYLQPLREIGVSIFPVHSVTEHGFCTCGDPECIPMGKHPACKNGVSDASPDYKIPSSKNYGIQCGVKLAVLDVDPRNGGNESLERLIRIHGELPLTWGVDTGGGGYHYYFKGIEGIKSKLLAPGLDFQGTGKYVVGPGSKHKSGKLYEWSEINNPSMGSLASLPQWIIDACSIASEVVILDSIDKISKEEFETIIKNLQLISPDCNYEKWLGIGMGLHSTGWGKLAFDAWDVWSAKSAKYPGTAMLTRKWLGFKFRAKDPSGRGAYSYKIIEKLAIDAMDLSIVNLLVVNNEKKEMPVNNPDRLEPTGLILSLAEWIYDNAPRQYWEWAVASAFAIVSGVAQGVYLTPIDTPVTLNQIVLGKSAQGKDHYLSAIETVLRSVDSRLMMNEPASSNGLRETLYCFNSKVWCIDEVQDVFAKLVGSNNVHIQGILKDIKEIFGAKRTLLGRASKGMIPVDIELPTMGLFGFGTPAGMVKLMEDTNISGGLISRLIQWPLVKSVDIRYLNKKPCPEYIIEALRLIFKQGLTLNETMDEYRARRAAISSDKKQVPDHVTAVCRNKKVKFSDDAKKLFMQFAKEKNDYFVAHDDEDDASIVDRAPNIAMRFAALAAIGNGTESISMADIKLGIEITELTVGRAKQAVIDSHDTKVAIGILARLSKPGIHSRIVLGNSMRVNFKIFDDEVRNLVSQGRVQLTWKDEPLHDLSKIPKSAVLKLAEFA